jgi:predicted Zn-dependent protease
MRNTTKIVGLIVLLFFQIHCAPAASPQAACGFNQNPAGQRISWKANIPIKIYVDTSVPVELRDTVKSAINVWNTQLNKTVLVYAGEKSGTQPSHDNLNIIYWRSSWDQSSETSRDEQANTTIYYADNQLIEADIQVNASGTYLYSTSPNPSQVDLQSLLVHEIGHVLGMKHNQDEPSVMASKLSDGVQRRDLFSADVTNAKCEY